ncbi:S8 family serine peptidase [Patescibacteria group bacterium]|nr:S8 family serine peptidase [Patescibacteria group bacterium]MBU1722037.1 S8 family serine peptidase [Patescibacteria group bacterium]MBU1901760.1 S8 family serine peptidase [Patescibacteria group bacterium]
MKKLLLVCLVCAAMVTPLSVYAAFPNDPFARQWGYEDTQVYEAWEHGFVGSRDVIIAVIDNGFDMHHLDLRPNVWKNVDEIDKNGIDDDHNGYIDDVWGWSFLHVDINGDGEIDAEEKKGNNRVLPETAAAYSYDAYPEVLNHGSIVAGIIGARGNNNYLGSGIMQRVSLMNIRVVDNSGFGVLDAMDEAIHYAVDNGADVINMSLVGTGEEEMITQAIDYAYEHGVVVVAAAGNDNLFLDDSPRYPISADQGSAVQKVLGVSAIDKQHHITVFSNFGSSSIDLTAPGEEISGVLRYAPKDGFTEAYGSGWSGTSFAAPYISAAAGLIKSVQPTWGAKEIYAALLKTAHKTPPEDEETYAHLFGKGLLQIDDALLYAQKQIVSDKKIQKVSGIATNGTLSTYKKGNISASVDGEDFASLVDVYRDRDDKEYYLFAKNDQVSIQYGGMEIPLAIDMMISSVDQLQLIDVLDGFEPEIVLFSPKKEGIVYQVYSLSGVLLFEQKGNIVYTNVLLTSVYDAVSQKEQVVLWSSEEQETVIDIYTFHEEAVKHVVIKKHAEELVLADTNGNGIFEVVLIPGGNDWSAIERYNYEGVWINTIYPLSYDKKTKRTIALGDYTHNGKAELIVAPANGKEVYVYSFDEDRIAKIRGIYGPVQTLFAW